MKEFSRSSFKLERASSMGHGRSLDSGGGLLLGTRSISARFAGYKRLSKSMRLNTSESDHYNDNKFDNQCYGSTTEENKKKKKKKKKKNLSFKFISKVFSFNKKNHTTSSSDCEDGMCQRLDVNGTQEKKKKKNFSNNVDVSLKLSTRNGGEEPGHGGSHGREESLPQLNWATGWTSNQVASMGGQLVEALRSSASHSSPTSVLHQLPRSSASGTSYVGT
ncbi:hypothetical protein LWI28_011682 [Acer negundo]|uniref:Uncharacterized protein n=1 Tax=Acer negundo TaxID=4023 RepID=A0AAD5NK08_ACENE|nr:hypothetical protein LWI28_011682 [Acer negundo]